MWWRKGSQVRSTISAVDEKANIDVVKGILQVLGKPESLITFVKDRPGHDWRYSLDTTKSGQRWVVGLLYPSRKALPVLLTGIWYLDNEPWWRRAKSGEYREFVDEWYKIGWIM
ncbi:hypothetical protein [Syntrophaceticus schinkii]|uniref:dTDP-glucose 4,6-dehydratase n=1 Tax=Syntrophaceticus schinkii TaxID=499207 RepID=A0A0B7MNU7_9FIRM